MNNPNLAFPTALVAFQGRFSWAYLSALVQFYITFALVFPVAYIFNRSYILHHPGRPLPVSIAPSRNRTIHSFYLNSDMYNHIIQKFPRPPKHRRWLDSDEFTREILPQIVVSSPITLEGDLQGPQLRQGMLAIQGGHAIYIQEEYGRFPSRNDLISTHSVALGTGNTFPLFIPIRHMDLQGLHEGSLRESFQETVTFVDVMSFLKQNLPHLNPDEIV